MNRVIVTDFMHTPERVKFATEILDKYGFAYTVYRRPNTYKDRTSSWWYWVERLAIKGDPEKIITDEVIDGAEVFRLGWRKHDR